MKVSAERLEVAQTAMSGPLKQLETADEFSEQALQDFTLATLFYVLEPQWPGRIIGLGGSHQHIVKYCHERVLESPAGEALSILDLCRELKIPRRTLHYSFEKIVGSSPLAYLPNRKPPASPTQRTAGASPITAISARSTNVCSGIHPLLKRVDQRLRLALQDAVDPQQQ